MPLDETERRAPAARVVAATFEERATLSEALLGVLGNTPFELRDLVCVVAPLR